MKHPILSPSLCLAVCLMASCSSSETSKTFSSAKELFAPTPTMNPDSDFRIGLSLSLQEALDLAMANSPEIGAAEFQIQAQQERLAVAGRLPDPELTARLEAVPLSSPRTGQETLLGLSQAIPLSGQLEKSADLEQARLETLQIAAAGKVRELEAHLRGAFATTLALQNAQHLQKSRAEIAQVAEDLMQQRIFSGDDIASHLAEARAQRVRLEAENGNIARQHQLAVDALLSIMGVNPSSLSRGQTLALENHLSEVLELPRLQRLADQIGNIPAVAEAVSKAKVAELTAVLAAANQIPMVNLELFYRGRDGEADGVDAGIMFELPLSGRAAANTRAARAESRAAAQLGTLRQREALIELKRNHAELSLAIAQVKRFQTEFIPNARLQLMVGEARLQAGDISLAEVLPLRSLLIQTQLEEIQAWHQMMSAWAELSPFLP